MKVTEPSSAIKQLKQKFCEIQDSLSMIEHKQTQLFRSIPEPPSRTTYRSRPASVSSHRNPELERENKRLATELQTVTRERDILLAETQQLKTTLAARNKVISELTRANERLKDEWAEEQQKERAKVRKEVERRKGVAFYEEDKNEDVENEDVEDTENSVSEEMPYMAMNLYALDEEPQLAGCLREKRNLFKQMNCVRPQQKFSQYYQDKSSRLAQQLLGR